MKKGAAVALLLTCLSLYFGTVTVNANKSADEEKLWGEMNRLAGQAWNLGKEEKFDEAVSVLKYTSKYLSETKDTGLTPEKQRVLQHTFDTTLFTLGSNEESNKGKLMKVTEVMMLVDALQSENQPLWKQAELTVMAPFEEMQKAAMKQEKEKFNVALNQFLQEFETIRPALVMDLSDDKLALLDGHLSFLENKRMTMFKSEEEQIRIETAAADFESVFQAEEDESDPSIFWLIFSIGGIIFSTLSYVSWRKYNGEKEKAVNAEGK
ncbi:sporulation protein YpjB [Fictibacillus iocasae]|uniref:Sporulation protein YpjB n=1 Tax=Fictibacillus iocasae TaxID=2715437 RepID=A0ABW2NM89_9BACL